MKVQLSSSVEAANLIISSDALHLTLPDALWQPCDPHTANPHHHLVLCLPLFINGTGHHVGAALLKHDECGELQEFRELADPDLEDTVMAALQMMHEGVYEATVIQGRPYVVYMTPFAD